MYIDCLQRHLAVCSIRDLDGYAKRDPEFWNVVSVLEPAFPGIEPRGFKQVHKMVCFDVVGREGLEEEESFGIPREEHMRDVLSFADRVYGEPLLIHCKAGVSRSTAVALVMIVRGMVYDAYPLEEICAEAPGILLSIRPKAMPNPLILELGLSQIFEKAVAHQLMVDLVNHPGLFANRYQGGRPT